ncbi:MAG TPA: AI-2E family transporter [Candidatus Acidoferrales bacterium]|nr:AI-2E family transporter [Candidatus Acidoferrales bacterium]
MTTESINVTARSNASQRIIAAGMVVAFFYWASSVVMTLLLSVLLAYFLEPFVEGLERFRVPRALGALLVVLLAIAIVIGLMYLLFDRAEHFASDWPKYSSVLKQGALEIDRRLEKLETRFSELAPRGRTRTVLVSEPSSLRSLLVRGIGSLYSILLTVTFVPFLVFFMLAAKRDIWHATLRLFAVEERTRVKQALEQLTTLLRSYLVGNVLVAGILVLVSWIFFWIIGLDYPFLSAVVSGSLNMVPYLGAVAAWVPPIVVGLPKWRTSVLPYLGVAALLSAFHILAVNVLMPALVGRRVHLNALAVTIALLFWGWLWGAIGLILAIPITAALKVCCDNVESLRPVGRWLSA